MTKPLVWGSLDDLPVLHVNQLLAQVEFAAGRPDAVLLTAGHASGPPLIGSPEEQARQLMAIPELTVRPLVRLSLSPQRLREWVQLLQTTLTRIDAWPVEEATDGDG